MPEPDILQQDNKDCCGCAACEAICPVGAITMQRDREWFLYPEINLEKCISCELCNKVCAFKQKDVSDKSSTIKNQFAVKYKRGSIRRASQAGGSFAALAISLLENNKNVSVYGACLYDVYKVKHISIHEISEIGKLQESKYIQSNMLGIYKEIAEDLKCGNIVMFAGTPCQNHAVKQFLSIANIDSENLYLMDFICEGVGSPYIWAEYIKLIEKRFKGKVCTVHFRDKRLGWRKHYETLEVSGYSKTIAAKTWTNAFYKCLFFRESCHNCRYTSQNRESDITVCWFGNVEKKYPGFDDGNGVSGIMLNTSKGEQWYKKVKSEFESISVTMDDLMQKQLQKPIEVSPDRDSFWHDFENGNKWKTMERYASMTLESKIKRILKNMLQRDWKWI